VGYADYRQRKIYIPSYGNVNLNTPNYAINVYGSLNYDQPRQHINEHDGVNAR
jgi:hypothetical protein